MASVSFQSIGNENTVGSHFWGSVYLNLCKERKLYSSLQVSGYVFKKHFFLYLSDASYRFKRCLYFLPSFSPSYSIQCRIYLHVFKVCCHIFTYMLHVVFNSLFTHSPFPCVKTVCCLGHRGHDGEIIQSCQAYFPF
jgi:hypothetical protein